MSGSGSFFNATINRGQYVECRTPQNSHTFCSVQSTRPVSVMSYTLGNPTNSLGIDDPSMVYIPPVDSYLTQYSLISLLDGYPVSLSYTLQESDYIKLNTSGLLVNGNASVLSDLIPIECIGLMVCGRGATRLISQREMIINVQFSGNVPFWGYAHGFARQLSYAYPLSFEMKPIGCKFYTQQTVSIILSSFL